MSAPTPAHIRAEGAILGSMLLEADAAVPIAQRELEPHHFFRLSHRATFEAICTLHASGDQVSYITLQAELERAGMFASVGGDQLIADLMGRACAAVNIPVEARIVRRAYERRQMKAHAERLMAAAEDPGAEPDASMEAHLAAVDSLRHAANRCRPRLADMAMDGETLMTAELPEVESLVGTGLAIRGGVNLIISHAGLGKTWLALQLANSLITGTDFFGFQCVRSRVGFLEMEMPQAAMRDRLKSIWGGFHADRASMSMLSAMGQDFRLAGKAAADELCHWIESKHLDVMFLDPLADLIVGTDREEEHVAAMLEVLRIVRRRTNCCFFILHHVNKLQPEKGIGLRTATLLSIRGHTRLSAVPETVLGLVEHAGQKALVFAKTRYCGGLPDFYSVRQDSTGAFIRCDSPDEVVDKNSRRVSEVLMKCHTRGATLAEIIEQSGMSRKTCEKYLSNMLVATREDSPSSARNKPTRRYFLPQFAPDSESDLEQISAWDDVRKTQ